MTSRNDGGSAFPAPLHNGMSLRDWFAGQCAAAALVSAEGLGDIAKEERAEAFAIVAEISYELADAMIAARKVKQ